VPMLRLVLDTTILISALRSRNGASAAILDLVLDRRFTLLLDYKLLAEYRDVALRSEHIANSYLSREEITMLVEALEERSEAVDIHTRYRPLSIDPDDDFILELAINGLADVIVTTNLRHLHAPAKRYGIEVVTSQALLITMKQGDGDADPQ